MDSTINFLSVSERPKVTIFDIDEMLCTLQNTSESITFAVTHNSTMNEVGKGKLDWETKM